MNTIFAHIKRNKKRKKKTKTKFSFIGRKKNANIKNEII